MIKKWEIIYKLYNNKGIMIKKNNKKVLFRSNFTDGVVILKADGWKFKNTINSEKLVFAKYDGKKIKNKLVYTMVKING